MSLDRREISQSQLAELRRNNTLNPNEYAYVAGDLVVAENATDGTKRVIGNVSLLTESDKRVLKG
jgi:hypothetical protein